MSPLTLLALAAPLALAGCTGGEKPLQGYIEGTYVYASAESGGRVADRPVKAGQRIATGDILFRLDSANEKEAIAGAEARLAQAQAQLANLRTGKRPEELSVLAADLAAARTAFASADDDYTRKLVLREKPVVAPSTVDDAKSQRDTTQAQVQAAERQVQVARLPARPEEIDAAERNVAIQQAALAQAKIQVDRREIHAPAAGVIEETFFEPGEQVTAGQPVVSLLPDTNRKVRFFLPEQRLAAAKVGQKVSVGCDGCAAGLTATVDFIATAAEFTPPIIYSKDSREKLVFRVEAKPEGDAAALKIGQPVEVRLAGGGS
ncbi:HlyD family efflux transporter periplasmic adaptor subunit [soil metagenome]